jgi:hypothetical protein
MKARIESHNQVKTEMSANAATRGDISFQGRGGRDGGRENYGGFIRSMRRLGTRLIDAGRDLIKISSLKRSQTTMPPTHMFHPMVWIQTGILTPGQPQPHHLQTRQAVNKGEIHGPREDSDRKQLKYEN